MNANRTYLDILQSSLEKKKAILERLTILDRQMERLFQEKDLKDENFDALLQEKEQQILQLQEADDGFEKIYLRVQEELQKNAPQYRTQIEKIQGLIREITDATVALQVLEQKNKTLFSACVMEQRGKVRKFHQSKHTIDRYRDSMVQRPTQESFFLDRKK